jgi:hypothetical protein
VRVRAAIAGGAVSALVAAGCGGSGKTTSTHASSTPTATSTPGTTSTAPATGLEAHVLTSNELRGFTAQPSPVERNPHLYLVESNDPGSLAKDTARLKRLGFKGAVSENLSGPGQAGLSLVEQLGSPAAARSELMGDIQGVKTQGGGKFATFPVSGIPGAVGFSVSSPQGDGINITWADGPYYYLVGETLSSLQKSSEDTLNAAARSLYQHTHG